MHFCFLADFRDFLNRLYKVDLILGGIFAGSVYFLYICWVGDHLTRSWRKWVQFLVKIFVIVIFLIGIYVFQGPIRDTLDFRPIEKEITVLDFGANYKINWFYSNITDIEGNSFQVFSSPIINRGDKLYIVYVPYSNTILYYKRIARAVPVKN